MNKPLMENFLQEMLVEEKYNCAVALNAMLQDLINYRRDRIIDTFKFDCYPFTKVGEWYNCAFLDGYFLNGAHFAIDVVVEQDRYRVQLFDRIFTNKKDKAGEINPVVPFLNNQNLLDSFFEVGDRWEKQIKFPTQEKELYEFVQNIKIKLKSYGLTALVNE